MRIAFLDPIDWDYTIETVYQKPMGGSSSAICYLAEAIARLGHDVFLLNNTTTTGLVRGVMCLPHTQISDELRRSLDVLVIVNLAGQGETLRAFLGDRVQLILWSGHAHDQQAIQALHHADERDRYDGFALVSHWQSQQYQQQFGIPENRIRVCRNAISPTFRNCFGENSLNTNPDILSHKTQPPLLAYTSTPFRGLSLLIDVFPAIRQAVPGTRLQIFSSMKLYWFSDNQDEAEYGDLYRRCQETEGIEYIGAISQPALAEALKPVTVLAYPNTFAETSCIAVMEAIASGCQIVTSDLGALPETTAGFGYLVPATGDWCSYQEQFTETIIRVLWESQHSPDRINARLKAQVDYANTHYTWETRAVEWLNWLEEVIASSNQFSNSPLEQQWFQFQDYTAAITHYEKAIATDPNTTTNYWYLGLAHLLLGAPEAAQAIWLTAFMNGTTDQVTGWVDELKQILQLERDRQQQFQNNEAVLRIQQCLEDL